MQPEDLLTTTAQLGVAIVGFNGIATALSHSRGERRSEWRRITGSILVTAASSVIAWSVIPLVLLSTPLPAPWIWRISSLGWSVYQIAILSYREWQRRKLGLRRPTAAQIVRVPLLAAIGLQLWNGFGTAAAWPHLVGISSSLLVAMTSFFSLVHDEEP